MATKTTRRICEYCGNAFLACRYQIKHGNARFCSKECFYANKVSSLEERFWKHIDKNGPTPEHVPDIGNCWMWLRRDHKHSTKYTVVFIKKKVSNLAHRISWEIHNGSIPENMCVLHKCDNRGCVRPDHLFLGTKGDNHRDCITKGRTTFSLGGKRFRSLLTEAQAQDIINRKLMGDGPTKISRDTGLSYHSVYGVWSGRTWKESQ